MKISKNSLAVIASLVMITLAFGSFPASKKPLDSNVQPNVPERIPSETSDSGIDRTRSSETHSSETSKKIDPDAKIEFEKQKIAYVDLLSKWKELQQSIPKIESDLRKSKSQLDELENKPPAQPSHEEREWISADGNHKTIATLLESDFKTAKLKKSDGTFVTVEKAKLSDEGKALIEKAFVDKEIYSKRVTQWQKEKEELARKIDDLNTTLDNAHGPEPMAPDLEKISEQIASQKRIAILEEQQRIAAKRMEDEQRKAAEKEAEKRKAEEEDRKYKERFVDKNGLTLDLKSIQTERNPLGITISGVVYNRNKRKLTYAQISFNLYDSSGAQVGTALANINGLEPDGAWKFSAIGLADDASKYKFDDMSGF